MTASSGQETTSPKSPSTTPLSRDEAIARVVETDPRFHVERKVIRDVPYTVFANAPANLRVLLQQAVADFEEREMLVYGDQRWTYRAFAGDVNRMAHALAGELGVKPGDRVGIAMRNYPEMPILLMAIVSAGAVVVPLNAWWSGEELVFALKDSGVSLVFSDRDRYQSLEPHVNELGITQVAVHDATGATNYTDLLARSTDTSWPETPIDPEDDFAILYSSGSSGRPKGVLLTHRGAISSVHSWVMGREVAALMDPVGAAALSTTPASLIVTPLFHVTALHSMFLQGMALGVKLVLMYKWNPDEAVALIQREQVTRFVGVPTQSAELIAAAEKLGASLDSLETVGAGGAKRPASQVNAISQHFPTASPASGWGMTETNSLGIIASGPEYVANPEAAGRLTPPLQEMRILDNSGRDVPKGEIGELAVRSPANMRGYLNLPEETSATLRDGWLLTGDLAREDDTGLVYIVDRKKSIIIRGGENIACLEVEGALYEHPDVAEACVFPVPDERLGEIVGAAIQLHEGTTTSRDELRNFLRGHLAAFKLPEKIWFWEEPLPRGGTGKLDRKGLQQLCNTRDD